MYKRAATITAERNVQDVASNDTASCHQFSSSRIYTANFWYDAAATLVHILARQVNNVPSFEILL